jgi:hypothetical protein
MYVPRLRFSSNLSPPSDVGTHCSRVHDSYLLLKCNVNVKAFKKPLRVAILQMHMQKRETCSLLIG